MQKPKRKSLLQLFLAVALLVAFVTAPVEFAITKTTVARIEHSEWLLEMASVSLNYHPELIGDHLNRCYVQILHSVLSVFGNSMAVARQFQNVLWMFAVLFGYLTIRRLLTGGWIATITLAVCVATVWLRPEDVYQLRSADCSGSDCDFMADCICTHGSVEKMPYGIETKGRKDHTGSRGSRENTCGRDTCRSIAGGKLQTNS